MEEVINNNNGRVIERTLAKAKWFSTIMPTPCRLKDFLSLQIKGNKAEVFNVPLKDHAIFWQCLSLTKSMSYD